MAKSKVLIVDDEEDVVAALQFRLATAGYEVLAASHGAEALEVLKREAVDLVLADFMMPEINGLELTRLVKANPNWHETQIVLFSCNSEPEFRNGRWSSAQSTTSRKPAGRTRLWRGSPRFSVQRPRNHRLSLDTPCQNQSRTLASQPWENNCGLSHEVSRICFT